MVPLGTKSINWTCQLVIAIAALVAKLMQPLLRRPPVLCGSIFAGSKVKINWRPSSHRQESSGISVRFAALTSWPSVSRRHTSLCAWQRSMKTQAPNLPCTSGVHMTFGGYRTIRAFRSIKNGNPVGNAWPMRGITTPSTRPRRKRRAVHGERWASNIQEISRRS